MIGTPIGNMKDISFRALEVFNESEAILCEDTRRTSKILNNYNIKKKLITINEHNERRKTENIIEILKKGSKLSLVSDGGLPTISDPGYYLIKRCREENIEVSPIPGANAGLSALMVSGFATDQFLFYGFLSKKKLKRKKEIQKLLDKKITIIIYESPYRIIGTLKDIIEIDSERKIMVAKEITKKFEKFFFGRGEEIIKKVEGPKGEYVIIISK